MKNIFIFICTILVLSFCFYKAEEISLNPQSSDATIESPKFSVSILNGLDKTLKFIPFRVVTEPNGVLEITKEFGNHIKQLSFKTENRYIGDS